MTGDNFKKTGIKIFTNEDFEDASVEERPLFYSPVPRRPKTPLLAAVREVLDGMSSRKKSLTVMGILAWQVIVYGLATWKIIEIVGLL